MTERPLPPAAVDRLRSALDDATFTVDAVAALLGPEAHAALGRNETTPAMRRTRDDSPLSTLVRLWPLQAAVPRERVERALPGLVEPLEVAGILESSGGEVRARLDIRPYGEDGHDWWVASDLTPGLDGRERRMAADHVLGVSGASTSLAQLTVRGEMGRTLDLGTGSGVQALHLAEHSRSVVATDVNPRCLLLADLTARLNAVDVDLRSGSLWEPVVDETFDLIVSNPPFVVSPGTEERLVYRDSGLPGDEVVRQVVAGAVRHLAPAGTCQVLANWVHRADEPWHARLEGWLAPTGCHAWVVERELTDPARYVELWLDDAGLRGTSAYTQRYETWLDWFEGQGLTGVGFGWITITDAAGEPPVVQVESWPFEVEQPIGPHVEAWIRTVRMVCRLDDAALLGGRLRVAPDVVEERLGPPGGAEQERIVLRSHVGMRRARSVSTAVAGMVGACDGDLTLGQIVGALSTLLDTPADALRAELVPAARGMLVDGILFAAS